MLSPCAFKAFRTTLARFFVAIFGLLMSALGQANIVEIKVSKTSPYGQFKAGSFVRIEGELKGELAPNEPIPGLDKAAKNARGRIEYVAPFVVIMPTQEAKGNGALLIDVPNRGRPISHFLYNSGRENFLPLELDPRTGFLQHQGFTVATVQWELGQGIKLPTFVDEAGVTRFVEGVGLAVIRDFFPVLRASLLHLDRWVATGKAPPPSRLMPLEPQPGEVTLLQAPMHLPGAIVQVPLRDADGNSLGGVRLPDLVVPLGTHGAQNLPLSDRACNLNAAYIPFAPDSTARLASDTRPSLAERYSSSADYLKKVRAAGQKLIRDGFLLEEDLPAIIEAANKVRMEHGAK